MRGLNTWGHDLVEFFQIGIGALATLEVAAKHDGTRQLMFCAMAACGVLTILFLQLAFFWRSRELHQ